MAAFPDSSIAAQLSRIPGFDISKRVVMLGILILIMLIPLTMIGDVVYERSARRYEVENQIAGQWGESQIVGGPVLMIPYVTRSNYVRADGSTGETVTERLAYFLPDKLAINAGLDSELRRRSLHEVLVYNSKVELTGSFCAGQLQRMERARGRYQMGLRRSADRRIRHQRHRQPGHDLGEQLPEADARTGRRSIPSTTACKPRHGFGRRQGPWIHDQSFAQWQPGAAVPAHGQCHDNQCERRLAGPGFHRRGPAANPHDQPGRTSPPTGTRLTFRGPIPANGGRATCRPFSMDSAIGVELTQPGDVYQQSDRIVKYGLLVIGLTFATIFVVGLLTDVRAHMVQYLLVGGSICIFYLLVLSLSEQIRFDLAYGIASALDIAVVSLYVGRTVRRHVGLVAAAVLAMVHGWMFVLLQMEDFVLLSGTIGLLLALVTVMYVTRNVDWYRIGPTPSAGPAPAAN